MKGHILNKKRRLIYLLIIIVLIIGIGIFYKYVNDMKVLSKNKIIGIAAKALENEEPGFDIKIYSKVKVTPARENPGFTEVKFSPPIVYVSSKGSIYRQAFALVSNKGEVDYVGFESSEGYDKEDIEPVYFKIDSNAKKAIDFVDAAVKKDGYFDGDGLEKLSSEYQIIIIDDKNQYHVNVNPDSGSGHAYMFNVDKKTGDVSNMSISELADPY